MKTIHLVIILLISAPFIIFAQEKKSISVESPPELEVNGIIFSSSGGVKFPDGSVQTTAYLRNPEMESEMSAIVLAFDPSTNIEGMAQSAEYNITNGLNILSASNEISNSINLHFDGSGTAKASFNDLSISRLADENSPLIRGLLASGEIIDLVELFFFKMKAGGIYELKHKIRMQDCAINSYSYSNGGDQIVESISITFSKVHYCSYPETVPSHPIKFAWDIIGNEEILPCLCDGNLPD